MRTDVALEILDSPQSYGTIKVREAGAHIKTTIDALVAALEGCIEDIKDSAAEIAENGGVAFDRDAEWQEGSAMVQALAALALARGEK